MPILVRSVSAAIAGALIGAAFVTIVHARRPGVSYEMDHDANRSLPSFFSGIYGGERDDAVTFAWSSGQVVAMLDGLDRSASWSCILRFRSPRPADQPQPAIDVLVDGSRVIAAPGSPEYLDLGFLIPESTSHSATITINVSPTFQPGTTDKRTLGIQIDRLSCEPGRFVLPPRSALIAGAGSAALLAGMAALVGVPFWGALLVAFAVAFGAAEMMTTGSGIYTDYPAVVLRLSLWVAIALGVVATGAAADRKRKDKLSTAARAVFTISAVALLLKLMGLVHPAKPVIDALFHAHRLDQVLAGQRHFTQPFIGDVQMPYAVGLYLFTGLWTWITSDHMALVRGVTAAADVVAGGLLYPVVLRAWNDRRAALMAVLVYQLLPLSYALLGNANLTNVFGESMALVTMAAAVSWTLHPKRVVTLAAFVAILTWALCSHVSTVTTLSATLGVLAVLFFWRGDAARRWSAAAIAIAVLLALALAWVFYYQHFSDAFIGAFNRMFGAAVPDASAASAAAAGTARGYMTTGERVADLLRQAASSVGTPLLILAALGTYDLLRRGQRDRLASALLAWAVAWAVFSASTVFAKVGDEYVRYAAEFLGRINLATLPLVAILAGKGAASPGITRRALSFALLGWAAFNAWGSLIGWFSR